MALFRGGRPGTRPIGARQIAELFDEEPDGYLRFRHTLLRDSAYEGLPLRLRRQLHSAVAAHIEEEMDFPEEAGGHIVPALFRSGRVSTRLAVRHGRGEARRRRLAYVEAARLYPRALEAGRQIDDLEKPEDRRRARGARGCVVRAGEFRKAAEAYTAARQLIASDPLAEAES